MKSPSQSPAVAFAFPAACAVFLGMMLLCGCGRKQWTYAQPPAPVPSKDFDVHFDPAHLDPNGAARNVDWAPQLQGRIPDPDACNNGQPYSSACTQNKPFMDPPDVVNGAICVWGKLTSGSPVQPFFGHADWMVAQYDGSIGWFNFGADSDYGLLLVPSALGQGAGNEHGITTNNSRAGGDGNKPRYIEMEMDSDETDGAFSVPSSWWAQFKEAAQSDDTERVDRLFHPSDAKTLACGTAVGLFGLDCDHGCRSELHPVYALAIQRSEDRNDNEWSVLVRNWGTGGFCSQYNDELAATSLSLVLPYSSSQPPTTVEVQDFLSTADSGPGVQCPKIYFQDGEAILNLTLPPPESRAVAAFSLKIQWPAGAQAAACPQVAISEARAMHFTSEGRPSSAPLTGEDYLEALLRGINQGRRLNFEKDILPKVPSSQARLKALRPMAGPPPAQSCKGSIPVNAGRPQPAAAAPVHKLQKDLSKRARNHALRTYVCQQYRARNITPPVGTQQDLDQACKGVK